MVTKSSEKQPLTESQAQVLKFIKDTCAKTGVPPSYREIQKHFGYKAIGSVQDHVRALMNKGALEKSFGGNARQARGLIPSGQKWEGVRRLPVYGEIAAGGPRASEQLELGHVMISEEFCQGECFALRVVGDSMVDVGIFEGDCVIVQRTPHARPGDIVVALLEGETTVKRFKELDGKIFLVPENSKMKPISVSGRNLQIQGKVIALQRKI